jgi:copper chaperone
MYNNINTLKMTTEKIIIANLKCNGCATTIKNDLMKINGVTAVEVDIENDAVNVSYGKTQRQVIIDKLEDLGYPEATAKNGLLLQLKSYTSCMLGKIHSF